MIKNICLVMLFTVLAGCGGLEIESLTVEKAKGAHSSEEGVEKVPGYIVYHPMVVVEVKKIIKEQNGNSTEECVAGKPQTLPDYNKPFLLRLTQGIGQSSVDIKIEDGWRLAGFKAETDNTAWFKDLLDIAKPAAIAGMTREAPSDDICKSGLYKFSIHGNNIKLERIQIDLSKAEKVAPSPQSSPAQRGEGA